MSECEPTIAGYKINACESGALLIVNVLQCSKYGGGGWGGGKLSGLSQVVGYEARLQEGEVEQDGESGTSGVHLIIILSLHTVGVGLEDEG